MVKMGERNGSGDNPVDVSVLSFNELFTSKDWPLAVDTYQRGFVWHHDKIAQLIDDLVAYQGIQTSKPPYFMGTVLLHRSAEKRKRYVIDGQQRLTALCVLYYCLHKKLPPQCALRYSPASARLIRAAAHQFRQATKRPDATLFEHVKFTVVQVDQVDLAFTFFDTQNNRGVPLHATDLLKAYHLRAVTGATTAQQENLQTQCARRWEQLQNGKAVLSHEKALVQAMFTRLLWRARRWTGRRALEGNHDALLHEFQSQSLHASDAHNTVPLYQARSNRRALSLTLAEDGRGALQLTEISLSPHAADLPFAIRQPIHRGLGFFLYADKYAAMLRRLMRDATSDRDVLRFRDVYHGLMRKNSLFLEEIFLLSVLFYADQFGSERLYEFSLWLEHALGAVRVEKQQVRQESAQKFFRDAPVMNLLDVIAGAFRPDQVIDHLKSQRYESYRSEEIDAEKSGVQAAYKRAVLDYYGQPLGCSLAAKGDWVARQLSKG
ncbi:DUF262 domain-containing protein [Cupriavidus sp. H18C2]|uniref:DUF262 domain-containing protein n=1 Tax=Cupriavidus sp. H18C2 TaxID=3241602 RepID=UPI003BF86777